MNIKATFQKICARRKKQIKKEICVQNDRQEILNTLMVNRQETINFLWSATMEEIAVAVEVLCPLVNHFPCKEIVEIFKNKQVQYKKINTICCVSYDKQIEEAERILLESKKEENTLKNRFKLVLESREKAKIEDEQTYTISHGHDHETLRKILCRNYDETIEFLKKADKKEIAMAVEVLDNLVECFKSWEIVEIFQKKAVEFSDVNNICEFDYFECVEDAEYYLKNLQ